MKSRTEPKHEFPMRFNLQGRSVVLRPLGAGDREPMVTFARALPDDDLLFLERDITQAAEVEAWILRCFGGKPRHGCGLGR